ncbi:hypothetical protein BVC80_9099g75 [Macleaya cordata]|uniref:Uncharacterized protein n=1 Tax=Macleaya cordata TaxID=56857 RepID=A0A200PVP2_MACCD|nr:hypothetical protein BVC80_9099g75 [Macleaya cordata]
METISLLSIFPCSITTSSSVPLKKYPNFSFTTRNPNFSAAQIIRCCYTKRRPRTGSGGGGSYWDSNAETLRNERFKFGFGDEPIEDDEDEDDGDAWFGRREKQRRNWWSDDTSPERGQSSGIWEEAIDNIWIFKVFSAFGWLLPAVVISMLLASGPKAFLMALALPLGQSALSFAIDKLFGRINNNPKPRSRTKKRPFARANRNATMNEEEEEDDEISQTSRGRSGYQSWVGADSGSVGKKDNQPETTFGGWDELDLRGKFANGAKKRTPRKTGGLPRAEMKEKLSKRGRNRNTPLLIRLLIAVFPFLGSWTKLELEVNIDTGYQMPNIGPQNSSSMASLSFLWRD